MRMQRLFRDLDIQFEAEQLRTLENQAQRRARMQYLAVTMRERYAAQHGSRIKVCGTDGTVREGCLEAIGQGWIQLSTGRENMFEGVIARVGADFIEMTLSPCEPYSAYSNALAYKERGVRIIPTSRICAIVTVN